MKYRPEIDGLRAIAVIPVILFHADIKQFSGGFVGVDIFFVISGYLITSIILSEKDNGTFSLAHFYERRARRILPALFFVILASLPFAWILLNPLDMNGFSKSLVAVSTFSSNILFWREDGYWGTASNLQPLLHTWSLSVEEQYYLLFPILIIAMQNYRRHFLLGSLILITFISLLVSQWASSTHPTAGYFLLPTRAWELTIGAIIAFYLLYRKYPANTPTIPHRLASELSGIIGLLLIGYSVFSFDETTPFPGFFALIPTIGAAFIIAFSSQNTLVGRLLSTRIPVNIGLISYGIYLWHQPLISFARHGSLTNPPEYLLLSLSLLSIPLAYYSWKYVEIPFRKRNIIKPKLVFNFAIAGTASFIIIGLTGYLTNGFSGLELRNKIPYDKIELKLAGNNGLSNKCDTPFALPQACRTHDEATILVWGDSFAAHLIDGILASNPNSRIIQMTKSACGPFFDVAPVSAQYPINWAKGCLEFTGQVYHWIKNNKTIKHVVISSPFTQYIKKGNKLLYRNGEIRNANIGDATKELVKTLNKITLAGATPIIFSPPPTNGIDLGRCLARAQWMGVSLDECNFQLKEMSKPITSTYNLLSSLEESYRVINIKEMICDSFQCRTHIGPTWIYRDSGHLSHEGSTLLGKTHRFYNRIVGNL